VQIFDKKKIIIFAAVFFSSFFGHQSLDPDRDSLEMLDPVSDSMNPDPQHCLQENSGESSASVM
jgi:hypothetical protein